MSAFRELVVWMRERAASGGRPPSGTMSPVKAGAEAFTECADKLEALLPAPMSATPEGVDAKIIDAVNYFAARVVMYGSTKGDREALYAAIAAHVAARVGEEREALLAVLFRHKSEIQSQVLKHYPDKSEQSKNLQGELLRQERLLLNIIRDYDELTTPEARDVV